MVSDNVVSFYQKELKNYSIYKSKCEQYCEKYQELEKLSTGIKGHTFNSIGATIQHNSDNDLKLVNNLSKKDYYYEMAKCYGKLAFWINNTIYKITLNDAFVGTTILSKYAYKYKKSYKSLGEEYGISEPNVKKRYYTAIEKSITAEDIKTNQLLKENIEEIKNSRQC